MKTILKARMMGSTLLQYVSFLKKCEDKENIELHHPDYVVMSRQRYNKFIKEINKRDITLHFDD